MNLKIYLYFLFIVIEILFLPPFSGKAQGVIFEKVFGSPIDDFARSVKQINSGKIFVAGYSFTTGPGSLDIALSMLDETGNLEWTKYYGEALDDYGFYLAKTLDEHLVIAGESYTATNGVDIIIIKTDTLGNEKWRKIYGTPVNESVKYIEETSDKGFILCGFQNDTLGSNDIYVVKLDSAGEVQWQKVFGGADNDYADMIRETPEGDYILTADTRSKGAGGYDIEVIKLNSAGGVIWDKVFGDSLQNGCQGILVTSDNKYLSYGETEIYVNSKYEFYIELLDSSGNSIWQKTIRDPGSDAAFSAIETVDGNFLLTGYSTSQDITQPNNIAVFKLDTLGNEIWRSYHGGPSIDIGYDIIRSRNGGYLITGHSNRVDEQFYLLNINDDSYIETAVNENKNRPFNSVFPNPSKGVFYINGFYNERVKIFSMDGRLLHSAEMYEQKLDLSFLNKGIYFLQLKSDTRLYHTKIILY